MEVLRNVRQPRTWVALIQRCWRDGIPDQIPDVLLLHSAYTLERQLRIFKEEPVQSALVNEDESAAFERMIDGDLFADGQALKTAGKQPVL
jgi:hypothetical protein